MPRWSTHPDHAIIDDSRNFEQNGYFLQTLVLPEHVGCHVDVPAHYIRSMADKTMDTFALDGVMGPAKKVDISGLDLGPGELLTLAQFKRAMTDAGMTVEPGDMSWSSSAGTRTCREAAPSRGQLVGEQQPGFH
jgi:arylformamidase